MNPLALNLWASAASGGALLDNFSYGVLFLFIATLLSLIGGVSAAFKEQEEEDG